MIDQHKFHPLVAEDFASVLATPEHILVLCAIDDNYAMPLAVMLQSAARNVSAGRHIHVLLIDGGISQTSQKKLEVSLAGLPITVHLVEPDHDLISDLLISHHATHSVYFRLLASLLLPQSIDRIIYLDADMIVKGDISELWEHPLDDHYCLAVPDIACPYIAAPLGDANFVRSGPYLATEMPVRNWQELGLEPTAPYFNSGVMVLNLRRWRQEKIEQKLLACLRDNEEFIWCWDQYALNVVFSGDWGKLPGRWNQGAHVYQYPGPEHSPIPAEEFIEMRDEPAIVHFTTEWKPWQYNHFHPLREMFLEAMDQTEFGGWRPQKPPVTLDSVLHRYVQRMKRLRRSPRKFLRRNVRRMLQLGKKSTGKMAGKPIKAT